jgi:CO/xanthine dehydrogenase Mo-binding subunit
VLRSPHPHALIKKVDTTQAASIKTVRAIVTWENVPDRQLGNPLSVYSTRESGMRPMGRWESQARIWKENKDQDTPGFVRISKL